LLNMNKALFCALSGLLILCPAARAQDDQQPPPFVTTPAQVVERMLALGGVKPGDFVVDLGSGDGRIVIAAAKQFGAQGVGIELHEGLVERARDNARAAGVAERAQFLRGDVLEADLSRATVVTIYLLPWLMDKLQPALLKLKPGTRIVAHRFTWTGWAPDRSETVRLTARHEGQGVVSQIHLWIVPAQVRGAWRAAGEGDWRLNISQNYQAIEIDASRGSRALRVSDARLSGNELSFAVDGARFRGRLEGERIVGELVRSGSMLALELSFARATQ
jgi:SAM-dependent methyltransferase